LSALAANLEKFHSKLAEVCESCGRKIDEITLVGVIKKHTAQEANELIAAGMKVVGENRIQEAVGKFPDLLDCEKHLIGHLQTNKVKEAVVNFDCVESVDSLRLAEKLNAEAEKVGKILPIFIEVNVADEAQKFGLGVNELDDLIEKIREMQNLKLEGLMVMGVFGDEAKTAEVFNRGWKLCEKFGLQKYSAGMSGDWEIAVKCKATHLRVGSLLFR
jgi:hypothetical protein